MNKRSPVDTFQDALQECRCQTLALTDNITPELFCTQSHPDFSPVGWHLGHIAYTESLWILEQLAKRPNPFPQYERLFAADGLPKSERQNLPMLEEILGYLETVRSQTISILNRSTLEDGRLWHWLIQHESQHAETIAMVLAMHYLNESAYSYPAAQPISTTAIGEMVHIEAGSVTVGCDAPHAIDNEHPAHLVSTESYWIDCAPVTCGQYQNFIESGGYQDKRWWSPEGWQWLQSIQMNGPLYWPKNWSKTADSTAWRSYPVCGVSWYEAEAYAKFAGKRLPTEAEWERAMTVDSGCDLTSGKVWEWTETWFSPYLGFQPFPYEGYSKIYFDGEHRVLKGGSLATPKWVMRPSFRNWYHPYRREVFAGFRCAM
ncbi:MAG: SUMF1/EgtB/PvdO family nonheme iron enzyme [Cyanobacteria bacterium P01_D01_bin.1]